MLPNSNSIPRSTYALIALYVAIVVWWLILFFTDSVNNLSNYLFAFAFSLIPLFGGIFGIATNFRTWGSYRSYLGKSILFISLGLITWGIGQVIFSFYNIFLQVEVPYPSIADVSFVASWPLWGVGVYFLSKTTGARYGFRSLLGKVFFAVVPFIILALSYYFLIVIARDGVLTDPDGFWGLFFDLAYPFGSVMLMTIVALLYTLSFGFLGGTYRLSIYLILIGFLVNYIADFAFSYTTTVETFFSGNWVDLLFATAMFLLSLGVALLYPRFEKSNST